LSGARLAFLPCNCRRVAPNPTLAPPHPTPPHPPPPQAAAILKAEVYGVARPEWAGDAAAVGREAAKVEVPEFQPRKGVRIETDPKVGGGWGVRGAGGRGAGGQQAKGHACARVLVLAGAGVRGI
jgi:hypothetical protein